MKYQCKEKFIFYVLLIFAGVFLYFGWRLFWFLTDDAYISFRYISNSVLGYGYVWNPPPFRPVEGYTNFLWVVLLDVVWRVFGISPPQSSNYISLFFSYSTLVIGAVMLFRIRWNPTLRKHLMLFTGLFLFGVITNRTFLAWSSSGLETAMFNFFITQRGNESVCLYLFELHMIAFRSFSALNLPLLNKRSSISFLLLRIVSFNAGLIIK